MALRIFQAWSEILVQGTGPPLAPFAHGFRRASHYADNLLIASLRLSVAGQKGSGAAHLGLRSLVGSDSAAEVLALGGLEENVGFFRALIFVSFRLARTMPPI